METKCMLQKTRENGYWPIASRLPVKKTIMFLFFLLFLRILAKIQKIKCALLLLRRELEKWKFGFLGTRERIHPTYCPGFAVVPGAHGGQKSSTSCRSPCNFAEYAALFREKGNCTQSHEQTTRFGRTTFVLLQSRKSGIQATYLVVHRRDKRRGESVMSIASRRKWRSFRVTPSFIKIDRTSVP